MAGGGKKVKKKEREGTGASVYPARYFGTARRNRRKSEERRFSLAAKRLDRHLRRIGTVGPRGLSTDDKDAGAKEVHTSLLA